MSFCKFCGTMVAGEDDECCEHRRIDGEEEKEVSVGTLAIPVEAGEHRVEYAGLSDDYLRCECGEQFMRHTRGPHARELYVWHLQEMQIRGLLLPLTK